MHAVVTGASSGIGEAIARRLAKAGWTLTLAARREEALIALAEELDVECFIRRTDLSDTSECEKLIVEATDALGPIDVLVNNAGIQFVEPAEAVTPDRIDLLMTVDLLSPLHLSHYVLQEMLARQSGVIVNVASMAGIIATPGMSHYNGAKHGLAAVSESMRVELRRSGVHVLTVYPGPVYTPMEAAGREAYTESWVTKFVPTGTPDVLASLIFDGIRKKRARIVYPRTYGFARYFRISAQWFTDVFTPALEKGN